MAEIAVWAIDASAWDTMRDVRLAALRDAPQAFGSSYQREIGFTREDWLARLARGANFLAYADEFGPVPAGLVGGFVPQPGTAELVSMWVHPRARGLGVGRALVAAVVRWAADEGHQSVHLWVTENNESARRLYERCGFTLTGERQPLPSHPEQDEIGMVYE
jgi:GNAT superfamily N-acetyltransferase